MTIQQIRAQHTGNFFRDNTHVTRETNGNKFITEQKTGAHGKRFRVWLLADDGEVKPATAHFLTHAAALRALNA